MRLVVERGMPVDAELSRVGGALLESALDHLETVGETPERAVHEARRNIRSLRALVRLLRPALGPERYGVENARLRDAAQLLSPHRDAHAQADVLEGIAKDLGETDGASFATVRRAVVGEADGQRGQVAEHAAEAARLSESTRAAVATWSPLAGDSLGVVRDGLRRSAKRVRRSHRLAMEDPTPERLHELRKRSKDIREQLRVLMPLKPGRLGRLEAGYDKVCDLLGEARDLLLLRGSLQRAAGASHEAADLLERLCGRAAERERLLTRRALRRSGRACGMRPRELSGLIRRG